MRVQKDNILLNHFNQSAFFTALCDVLKKDGVRTGLSVTFQCKHGIATEEHRTLGLLDRGQEGSETGSQRTLSQTNRSHFSLQSPDSRFPLH